MHMITAKDNESELALLRHAPGPGILIQGPLVPIFKCCIALLQRISIAKMLHFPLMSIKLVLKIMEVENI